MDRCTSSTFEETAGSKLLPAVGFFRRYAETVFWM
jgi:hypothetical protein